MPSPRTLLSIYLNDHLAGATAGAELLRRTAKTHRGRAAGAELEGLAGEVAEDRETLIGIMARLGVPVRQSRVRAGWLAEKAGRLKLNGSLTSRSPLSDVLELEAMRLGVQAKTSCWRTLAALADSEPGLDADALATLLDRADAQAKRLEALSGSAVSRVWG
ncbi:hypothetical protein MMF93_31815 [Streptomyces tubbatahanensis]|uniref:DUF892 family protein n=1 Tax=Streptomyces tubbatahanensis TaxID=2923272 RepID=A0ABY3Y1D1_9ACTN|nr:hypothetical protein [Streptomyces tubbatahanensis]UNT00553.1 hypothetical protein MMF93_31815 [Streptomyces tubbatahanensis]